MFVEPLIPRSLSYTNCVSQNKKWKPKNLRNILIYQFREVNSSCQKYL